MGAAARVRNASKELAEENDDCPNLECIRKSRHERGRWQGRRKRQTQRTFASCH